MIKKKILILLIYDRRGKRSNGWRMIDDDKIDDFM